MSLTDIYNDVYGKEEEKVEEKDLNKIAEALENLSEEELQEVEKIAEVEEALKDLSDEDLDKLAEIMIEDEENEKLAADFDALGRFMARGYIDELSKLSQDE